MNDLASELFQRLIRGHRLDGLALPVESERILIEGMAAPTAKEIGRYPSGKWEIRTTTGFPIGNRLSWGDLHFRRCDFRKVGLFSSKIENCVFENCNLNQFGLWDTVIENVLFEQCDLREAALGGIDQRHPRPNRIAGTTFRQCDLRSTAHSCESYIGCQFINCRFGDIDLLGAVFEDCTFEGSLDEATFRDRDPILRKLPVNRMLRCDLSRAKMAGSQFLNIDPVDMRWPEDDPDMILLPHGPKDWEEWGKLLPDSWFIAENKKQSGTPSYCSRSILRSAFSEAEVRSLEKILAGDS